MTVLAVAESVVEAMAKAHCDFFGGEGWWDTGLLADTQPKALEAMRAAIAAMPRPIEDETPTDAGEGVERTLSREHWHGIPVIAYHWPITEPDHPIEGLRERHGIAYHWSTGPEDATRLVSLDDVQKLLAPPPTPPDTGLLSELVEALENIIGALEEGQDFDPLNSDYMVAARAALSKVPKA